MQIQHQCAPKTSCLLVRAIPNVKLICSRAFVVTGVARVDTLVMYPINSGCRQTPISDKVSCRMESDKQNSLKSQLKNHFLPFLVSPAIVTVESGISLSSRLSLSRSRRLNQAHNYHLSHYDCSFRLQDCSLSSSWILFFIC